MVACVLLERVEMTDQENPYQPPKAPAGSTVVSNRQKYSRLAAVPALVVGVVLGWVSATPFFYTSAVITVPIAMLVLYAVIAWELRWWQEMRLGIPGSIMAGGIAVAILAPTVYGDFRINSVWDLFRLVGPFSSVNWALIGASIALAIVFLVAPINASVGPGE
jgi:hypothetical protein